MYIDGGRKLQAFGPCDEYGDHLPNGVSRVRLVLRTGTALHGINSSGDENCRSSPSGQWWNAALIIAK